VRRVAGMIWFFMRSFSNGTDEHSHCNDNYLIRLSFLMKRKMNKSTSAAYHSRAHQYQEKILRNQVHLEES
jgi:hypothetical protein